MAARDFFFMCRVLTSMYSVHCTGEKMYLESWGKWSKCPIYTPAWVNPLSWNSDLEACRGFFPKRREDIRMLALQSDCSSVLPTGQDCHVTGPKRRRKESYRGTAPPPYRGSPAQKERPWWSLFLLLKSGVYIMQNTKEKGGDLGMSLASPLLCLGGGGGGDSLWGKIKIEGTGKRKDKVEGKKEEMHKNNVRKCLKIAFFCSA